MSDHYKFIIDVSEFVYTMYKHCPLITAISGFSLLVLGVICAWYAFPLLISNAISQNTALREGTYAYKVWKKQPFPLQFKVYFFNVSNPEEVQNGGLPIVKEIGPYVFDEFRERINIDVNEDKDILKYTLKKTYFFNKEATGCRSEDDFLTVINAAIVGTALQVEQMLPTALGTISDAIPFLYPGSKDIFLRARVRDILFDGITVHCSDEEVEFICGAMKGALPKTIKVADNGKDFVFSMFGHLNNSEIGPWEMGRGLKNTTRGQVYSYLDESIMTKWNSDYCNMINGSDTTVFPSIPMPRPKKLYSFAEDFCRSMYVTYKKDVVKFGIPAVLYETTEDALGINSDNSCFCPVANDEDGKEIVECTPSGTTDITPCLKANILISYPHFYLADKKMMEYVSGMKPKKELHENYAILEPKTGTPLAGRKRIQMNILVKRFEAFELLTNVSETSGYFPILWLEEGMDLPDEVIATLHTSFSQMDLLSTIKWVIIIAGIVTMSASFVLVMYKERLMCFANNGKVAISSTHMGGHMNPIRVTDGIGDDGSLNGDGAAPAYPALYPQMDNRNLNNGGIVRERGGSNRGTPQWNANAWNKY